MASTPGSKARGSRSKLRLIEAAYDLLGEEGYHAFSARRVAQKAGLKPQLVHYYFRSMEELLIAVFQRSSARYFRLHDEALSSRHPVRALWALNSNLPEGKRMTEYVALGKVYPGLREEMRHTGERFRSQQIEAMERIYAERGFDRTTIGPHGIVLLMSAIARNFVIEDEVGVQLGHEEVKRLIAQVLDKFEPLGEGELAAVDLARHGA
ncbi:TetR/AcrR family transcriptional regulator [Novosphingobium sp. JCM 18896]|uniref:TetR/AcrR family transcriptional regulator n=1 Tax=Novosphingobium sp. JCM 18896 TaxID=2989731 RepID=UPI002223B7D9|nr:TetR/AcrR family transcriptional regulator [Novosphingobium sp. JCM 18896]MCW1429014.1 TetR/AcrR family transcriptional regulator [Novosphingobium sp. JCM 18896]